MAFVVKTLAGLGVVALAVVVLASAQGKVNFSGTWMLDKSQSDMSQFMIPGEDPEKVRQASMTMVVEQQETRLRVTRIVRPPAEELQEIHTYTTDGSETKNTGFRGESVVSRASWEGNRLVIVSIRPWKLLFREVPVETRGVWSLASNGKTLTIAAQVHSPRGEQRIKMVFNKQ